MAEEHQDEIRYMWCINSDRPWRSAQRLLVAVRIRPKSIILESSGGNKYLYGASGFGTEDAANRRRHELMRKILAAPYAFRFMPGIWNQVTTAMALEGRRK